MIDRMWESHVSRMRDHIWAKRAFHLRYGHCSRAHADHFRDGFVAGYSDVCVGGAGECPAIPPDKYWGFQYRSREGAEMQNAWFAGFEAGAGAARNDGSSTYSGVQISQQIEKAIAEAKRIEDDHAGIEREYIVDMAPVRPGSSLPGNVPAAAPNMPFIQSAPVAGQPTDIPVANTPMSIPHPGGAGVPSGNAGWGDGAPMPMQIVPAEVPIIPGASQR
jgi:hypothetical protein